MIEAQRESFGEFSVLRRRSVGPPSLTIHLAHATGFNAGTYRPLIEALEPTYDVHAMDARGHGFTEAPADPRRLRSWAPFRDDLEAYVATMGRPTVLIGHSMGATVSMALAARRPDWVAGLILVDPVIVPPSSTLTAAVLRALGLTDRLIPIARNAARRRMEFPSKEVAVENYVGKGAFKTWPREWIEAYVEGGTEPTGDGAVRLTCDRSWESRTFAKATVQPYRPLRRVRCPITLLTAARDGPPFTHSARDAFMQCQPGTRLLVLDDASHFLAMEHPDVVREEVDRMAAEVQSELG